MECEERDNSHLLCESVNGCFAAVSVRMAAHYFNPASSSSNEPCMLSTLLPRPALDKPLPRCISGSLVVSSQSVLFALSLFASFFLSLSLFTFLLSLSLFYACISSFLHFYLSCFICLPSCLSSTLFFLYCLFFLLYLSFRSFFLSLLLSFCTKSILSLYSIVL